MTEKKTYTSSFRKDVLEHIKKYPYEAAGLAAKAMGLQTRTIHTYRWYIRNRLGVNLPVPNAEKHAQQLKREGSACIAEAVFPYPHRTLAEVEEPVILTPSPEMQKAMREEDEAKVPNAKTQEAMHEAREITLKRYDTVEEALADEDHPMTTIDYIKSKLTPEEFAGYCKGSAMQCIAKAGFRHAPGKSLEHARWYLDHLLAVRGDNDRTKGKA